jgi:hypothetical protein
MRTRRAGRERVGGKASNFPPKNTFRTHTAFGDQDHLQVPPISYADSMHRQGAGWWQGVKLPSKRVSERTQPSGIRIIFRCHQLYIHRLDARRQTSPQERFRTHTAFGDQNHLQVPPILYADSTHRQGAGWWQGVKLPPRDIPNAHSLRESESSSGAPNFI